MKRKKKKKEEKEEGRRGGGGGGKGGGEEGEEEGVKEVLRPFSLFLYSSLTSGLLGCSGITGQISLSMATLGVSPF